MATDGRVDQTDKTLDALLDAIAEWREKSDRFVATGSDDDDVIVTHDAKGRLLECWPQPGLQQALTVDELEDAINAALASNGKRATEEFDRMADEFLSQFAEAPYTAVAQHPVAGELADALTKATRRR